MGRGRVQTMADGRTGEEIEEKYWLHKWDRYFEGLSEAELLIVVRVAQLKRFEMRKGVRG